MAKHTVREGECVSSIAYEHGLFPDTIWDHPDNSELKQKRKEMNLLEAGDVVEIPEKEDHEAESAEAAVKEPEDEVDGGETITEAVEDEQE